LKSKFVWAVVILVLLIGGWTLFDYGRFFAGYDSRDAGNEIDALLQTQDHLEKRVEGLREEKAVLERAAQIERKAYNELDQLVAKWEYAEFSLQSGFDPGAEK